MARNQLGGVLFNAAGVGVLLVAGGYIVVSAFHTEKVERCSTRYAAGMQFALDSSSGEALTANELQGRLGWRQWGLIENAKVIGLANAPGKKVLRVKLDDVEADNKTKNGVGFFWPVEQLKVARSACLSYRVYLPADFDFKAAGRLPGLAGEVSGIDAIRTGDPASFAARVGWSSDGATGTELLSTEAKRTWRIGRDSKNWTRGKWVTVEQEITLNNPGKSDGGIRFWVDGELRMDEDDLAVRGESANGFAGVVSDIGFLNTAKEGNQLFLTAPTVQWMASPPVVN